MSKRVKKMALVRKYPPEPTDNIEETIMYSIRAQCGECYAYYDLKTNTYCPRCGSLEIVGDR